MSRRSSLSNRLSRLKKDGMAPQGRNIDSLKQRHSGETILPGWIEIYPSVWKRSVLKKNILPSFFSDSLIFPGNTESQKLIFYDTETTGLSTGAGTIPFLIGLGRVSGDDFEIIQYFLADYPGESSMLESLKREFTENSYYISYNGKSYDSHLINTRFLLNRLDYRRREEVDLLYLSRRFWRNKLENCRLGTIESEVLGINRGFDIPGSEIPDVWFDYLKTGNTNKLELVFSHNLQDIYSLSILLITIERIISEQPDDFAYDKYGLARFLMLKRPEIAIKLLHDEFEQGNRKAGQFLSLYYKREENWDSAVKIWRKLNTRGYNYFAVEELAKYYEHKRKDTSKALAVVDQILKSPFSPGGEKKERLLYRRERLLRNRTKN
ncbi:MAG: ribonuclease H-like domain-containing protein [Spirochaetaceae bacterium]|nr:ribonuclease H-like domain-containing protein [Spirochaetaceae bacterium]